MVDAMEILLEVRLLFPMLLLRNGRIEQDGHIYHGQQPPGWCEASAREVGVEPVVVKRCFCPLACTEEPVTGSSKGPLLPPPLSSRQNMRRGLAWRHIPGDMKSGTRE